MAIAQPQNSTSRRPVDLAIVAEGVASLTRAELANMRRQSIDKLPAILRPQFLKHSEEQSLAALAAVSSAIEKYGLADDFHDWAVVSATRYLGRAAFAAAIQKYQTDGPWGVSVQVIPHTAPHAVASTLSLALRSHGPCLGAGAAPGEENHALLSAATLLQRPGVVGAWIVFSGWSAAPTIDDRSPSPAEMVCTASALAAVDMRLGQARPDALGHIRIEEGRTECPPQSTLSDLLIARDSRPVLWRSASGSLRIAVELAGSPHRSVTPSGGGPRHAPIMPPLAPPITSLFISPRAAS